MRGVTNHHSIEVLRDILTLDAGTRGQPTAAGHGEISATLALIGATVTGGPVTDNGAIHFTGNTRSTRQRFNGGHSRLMPPKTLTLDDTTVDWNDDHRSGTIKVDAGKTLTLAGRTASPAASSRLSRSGTSNRGRHPLTGAFNRNLKAGNPQVHLTIDASSGPLVAVSTANLTIVVD